MKSMVVVLVLCSVVALGQPSSTLFYGTRDLNFNILDYDSLRVWQTERDGHGLWWEQPSSRDVFFLRTDTLGMNLWCLDNSAGTWSSLWSIGGTGNVTIGGTMSLTGALTLAPAIVCDTNAFTGAVSLDTVTVTGAATSDKYIVTYRHFGTVWDSLGTLSVRPTATGFIVARDTASARLKPGVKYTWLRVK
jgi:hypothetical protein